LPGVFRLPSVLFVYRFRNSGFGRTFAAPPFVTFAPSGPGKVDQKFFAPSSK